MIAIVGGTLLLLLAVLALILLLGLRQEIAALRAERRTAEDRLRDEIRRDSPARAAVAAVIASRGEERLTAGEFRKEVEELLAQWPKVEELADRAAKDIAALLDDKGKTAAGSGASVPPGRRRRRRRGP